MNQRQLDILKERSAAVVVQYTNGLVEAELKGTSDRHKAFNDCLRLMYLWGAMKNSFLSGGSVYIGDTVWAGDDMESVWAKINSYYGIYDAVSLIDYSTIVADSGDSGSDSGDSGSTPSSDSYRSGHLTSVIGTNVVTFSSPLSSSSYVVTAWNIGASGYMQSNLVISTKTANGFVCGNVLEAGIIYYQALLET